MATRKPPARKAEQHELDEFAEKYETYTTVYGDPMEAVFQILANTADDNLKLQAAGMLMSFRFPKLKALETKGQQPGTPIQFNITLTAPKQELDITPPTLELVSKS